jgi:hypothetical protein
MFAWLLELDGRERKTLIATAGGWATDSVDVMIFIRAVIPLANPTQTASHSEKGTRAKKNGRPQGLCHFLFSFLFYSSTRTESGLTRAAVAGQVCRR